jgi:hypothetical protein
MSIFFPVNALEGFAFSEGALFAGATFLEVDAEVTKTARVTFNGATLLTFGAGQGSVTFAGSTLLGFAGRLNNEANVLADATFAGATALEFLPEGARAGGVSFDSATALELNARVDRAEEFGFTFFVDILDTDTSAALASNNRRYTSRLVVDGVEVPIIRANINAPDGALGIELSVILARPDVSQVTSSSTTNFDIGIWAGGAWKWINLLTGARMSGRGARYANEEKLPADSVEVTFVDVMGDRWNRAPGTNTILYDPQTVDAPTTDTISQQTIFDGNGAAKVPVYSAIYGMRLKDVIHAAYVEGSGFDSVVTNIDNFPVEQVVFSLTGGYDAGVRPLLAPFEPIFFTIGNTLWIVSLDNPLPAGFAAQDFPASKVVEIDDQLPQREPVNALLVHLKDNGTGEYVTEREEAPPAVPSGTFGAPGYTETETTRRVREYRNFLTPTVIQREEEAFLKVRVLDFEFNEISIDTRTSYFDARNRPTGYSRIVHSRLPDLNDPAKPLVLQKAEEETQTITYAPHPLNPQRDVQSRIVTEISGLIITDNDNQYLGKPYKISLHNGHKSGYVNADADASSQISSFGALKTVTETLRVQGGQVVRDRRVTDHVANVVDPPTTQVLPGDASFNPRTEGRTRTVLLTIAGTEASGRRAADFDGTGLPTDIAMKLAAKRLAGLSNPPRAASAPMAFFDVVMRRGLDLQLPARSGSLGTYIVRGYSGMIERNSEGVVEGKMSFQARELK